MSEAKPGLEVYFKDPPVMISIAMAALLVVIGYATFQVFVFFEARDFFDEWVYGGFQTVISLFAAYITASNNKSFFWHTVFWIFVTRIPIINLVPLFLAGRFWAQKELGLR